MEFEKNRYESMLKVVWQWNFKLFRKENDNENGKWKIEQKSKHNLGGLFPRPET